MDKRRWILMSSLLVGLLALTVLSAGSALRSLADLDHGDRPVDVSLSMTGDFAPGGLMPGSSLGPQELRISAAGDLEYGLRPKLRGSDALIDAVSLEIRDASGTLLYAGPLRNAVINGYFTGGPGRPLASGVSEVLTVTGLVSLSAGNEIAGTTMGLTWEVQASPVISPS